MLYTHEQINRNTLKLNAALLIVLTIASMLVISTPHASTGIPRSDDDSSRTLIRSASMIPTSFGEFETPDPQSQGLGNLYFYIDPGHSPANTPCISEDDPDGRGTGPHWGIYEGDVNLKIAQDLRDLLITHGANPSHVYMSRDGLVKGVSVAQRTDGTSPGGPSDCNTYGNNKAFRDNGRPSDSWRFISIHQNCCITNRGDENEQVYRRKAITLTIPLANTFAENIMYQENRPFAHGATPFWGDVPQPYELYVIEHSMPWQNNQNGASFNILAETGFLSEYTYNQWVQQDSNKNLLAQSFYRGLTDFFLVGKQGSINTKNQAIINRYRSSIGAGYDPGMPFDNGGGYYVHQWGNANTQEFSGSTGNQVPGSIVQLISTATPAPLAYYVRNPIWSTYIQKGGPNSNGPGLPTGDEHSWTTARRTYGRYYTYPKTMNFERGAIAWNSYEGGMSTSYDQHALFLANCNTPGIDDGTFGFWLKGLAERFSLSNDLTSAYDPSSGGYTGGYTSADLFVYDPANRAEIAQTLVWTESFNDSGTNWPYTDIPNYWARPFINIAADHAIANGYSDSAHCPQGTPCWRPNDNVSRQQLSKMESVARGWTLLNPAPTHGGTTLCPTGYNSFADVCYNSTFYQHIETVKAHFAIVGYPCGGPGEPCDANYTNYFRPGNSVSRGQMSKIIDQSLRTDGVPPPFNCWYGDFPGSGK